MIEKRPFATGSKPGPDAVDQYLETQKYYRKHVARDASSLFRVVSEHIFDIQKYHSEVRQKCASFMEENEKDYLNEVDKNFFNYVSNLRKPRTYGTLMELRVLARLFKKNVILFEPTSNMETTIINYVQNESYDSNPPMRIFYSAKDKHFDIIFPMQNIERIADCQAIVYGLLYVNVFKLPDVQYCTERMLHDQDGKSSVPLTEDGDKYKNQAGEIVEFDSPEKTNCVLKDPRTCHFHNQDNFEEIVEEFKNAVTIINRNDDSGKLKVFKPIDGFLYRKDISCVRQLLDEKITPYPYKAAKALDKSIYRNTEFEIWSENRREQRMKWLDYTDYPLKSGDKWMYYDRRNNNYNSKKFYDSYEQGVLDEGGYMALDDDMKKKYVVLDPSADYYKLYNFNHFVPPKESVELTVMANYQNERFNNNGPPFKNRQRGGGRGQYYQNRSYVSHRHNQNESERQNNEQQPQKQQQQQQPAPSHQQSQQQQENQESGNNFFQQPVQQETYESEQVQPSQSHSVYQPQHHNWANMNFSAPPPPPPMQVQMAPQYACNMQTQPFISQMGYQHVMPYGNFAIPPPVEIPQSSENDPMNLVRDSELTGSKVNCKAQESVDINGSDLPMNDITTVQFYYNLGIRYSMASGIQRRLESIAAQMESLEIDTSEKNKNRLIVESPSAPANTPVSTKPSNTVNYGSGHRPSYNNDNYRKSRGVYTGYNRSWNNNNNNNNNFVNNNNPSSVKKEIKFNSNVKNVHKNDQKFEPKPNVNSLTDKSSPPGVNCSLSPIPQEPPSSNSNPSNNQVAEYQVALPQSQYYPQIPYVQQHPQIIYQTFSSEDVSYAVQYPQPPYPYQGGQYYTAPSQQSPYPMYAVSMPNILNAPPPQQQQQQHQLHQPDSSVLSNDSGVVEQVYSQPSIQYSYQYPPHQGVPVYYASAPIPPQTPQIATQIAPVFTGPPVLQHQASTVQSEAQTQIVPFTETAVNVGFTQTPSSDNISKVDSVVVAKIPSN